jgi:hypothetical protein
VWERDIPDDPNTPGIDPHQSPFDDPNPANREDGVSQILSPFFPGGVLPDDSDPWMYLGFRKDGFPTWGNGVACELGRIEWHYVDSLWLWGDDGGTTGTDPDNYSAGKVLFEDPVAVIGFSEVPDEVVADSQYRVCVDVDLTPNTLELPETVEIEFGTKCDDDEEPTYTEVLSTVYTASYDVLNDDGQVVDQYHVYCQESLDGQLFVELSSSACDDPADTIRYAMIGHVSDPDELPDMAYDNDTHPSYVLVVQPGCRAPAVALP